MSSDLVAVWDVTLNTGSHRVEFEHGTTSGKRVIRINGKEILKKDWMFKLVGHEEFKIAKARCTIHIDAASGFAYEYSMDVNGKPLQKFQENQSKLLRTWVFCLPNEPTPIRVTLERDTLDVYVNGQRVDTAGEFVDNGTETHFEIGSHRAFIKAISSGNRREGIIHTLFIDNREIPPDSEWD